MGKSRPKASLLVEGGGTRRYQMKSCNTSSTRVTEGVGIEPTSRLTFSLLPKQIHTTYSIGYSIGAYFMDSQNIGV